MTNPEDYTRPNVRYEVIPTDSKFLQRSEIVLSPLGDAYALSLYEQRTDQPLAPSLQEIKRHLKIF